jgi:hypothetical protein
MILRPFASAFGQAPHVRFWRAADRPHEPPLMYRRVADQPRTARGTKRVLGALGCTDGVVRPIERAREPDTSFDRGVDRRKFIDDCGGRLHALGPSQTSHACEGLQSRPGNL